MKPKILLIDLESAPNIGMLWSLKNDGYIHPKNIISAGYVLSFSAKWLDSKEIMFFKTADGHLKMLKKIWKLLDEADAVVHYNGKRFDLPVLYKEFILHKIKPLPKPVVQIDLLHLVKRTFNFPSYKLDYVCRAMDLGGKVQHEGIEMWWSCMNAKHHANARSWKRMERYNKGDVRLLDRLYRRVRPWFSQTFGFKRIDEWLRGLRSRV